MFLKNLVMSCIKKKTSFTLRTDEQSPPTPPQSAKTSAGSRSRVNEDIVRESLGN